jgi:hypothetical protein
MIFTALDRRTLFAGIALCVVTLVPALAQKGRRVYMPPPSYSVHSIPAEHGAPDPHGRGSEAAGQ